MCSSFERLLNKEKADGRAEGWKDGKTKGKAEDVIELLEDLGELSDTFPIKLLSNETLLNLQFLKHTSLNVSNFTVLLATSSLKNITLVKEISS